MTTGQRRGEWRHQGQKQWLTVLVLNCVASRQLSASLRRRQKVLRKQTCSAIWIAMLSFSSWTLLSQSWRPQREHRETGASDWTPGVFKASWVSPDVSLLAVITNVLISASIFLISVSDSLISHRTVPASEHISYLRCSFINLLPPSSPTNIS